MKISFLVTYYNQARFVKQSLESILTLDIPCEYEILVGDDGSTDGTVEEVKKYTAKYPNIKLFIMDRDITVTYIPLLRASAIRLQLLENATGEFYCLLDGDDWYLSKTFVQEAFFVMEQDENVAVCAFNFAWVSDDNIKLHSPSISEGKNSAQKYLLTTYIHVGACVFRNVFDSEKIRFMKDFGHFDDQNIMAAHLQYGDLYYISKVSLAYRQTGVGIWTGMSQYEKHVLDAFEYDVLARYANNYVKEIQQRFLGSLRFVWKNRSKFYGELGSEKAGAYVSLAKNINGCFYRIITFDKLEKKDKYDIKNFLQDTFRYKCICFVKYVFYFVKKIIKTLMPYGLVRLIQLRKNVN